MKPLLKPGTMPRAKAGDFDKALALVAGVADAKATKKYLAELQDSTLAHDASREAAATAAAESTKREEAAREAESAATVSRQRLADETANARVELGDREVAVGERERLAGERETAQEARHKELARREGLLRDAGVKDF